jgi:hypothetical protein
VAGSQDHGRDPRGEPVSFYPELDLQSGIKRCPSPHGPRGDRYVPVVPGSSFHRLLSRFVPVSGECTHPGRQRCPATPRHYDGCDRPGASWPVRPVAPPCRPDRGQPGICRVAARGPSARRAARAGRYVGDRVYPQLSARMYLRWTWGSNFSSEGRSLGSRHLQCVRPNHVGKRTRAL